MTLDFPLPKSREKLLEVAGGFDPNLPIESMYGIFPYIYQQKSTIHVGKYTIHGWYGLVGTSCCVRWKWRCSIPFSPFSPFSSLVCAREILHSCTFTDRKQATGKKVIVIGGGKSAIDNVARWQLKDLLIFNPIRGIQTSCMTWGLLHKPLYIHLLGGWQLIFFFNFQPPNIPPKIKGFSNDK